MQDHQSSNPLNRLLDELPGDVCKRLSTALRVVALPAGKVVHEANEIHSHMVFPRTCVVALMYQLKEGGSGATALVGNEGVVGISLLVDSHTTPTRAIVQVAGDALYLPSEAVGREFGRGSAFQIVMLRYSQALISQMSQNAICNRHHAIEQQVCRWLLLCADRVESDEIQLTQEALASLLGVRREGVTEAARRLRDLGLIRYSRGRIGIVDRRGLESRSCECYQAVTDEYERLLSMPLPI